MPATRRSALKAIATAAAVAPVAAQEHQHSGAKDLIQIRKPSPSYKPRFFTEEEYRTVTALVDLIIPRTETPGASDAGVPEIIDSTVASHKPLQKRWREGLASLRKHTRRKRFLELAEEEQVAVLRQASESRDTPLGRFFTVLKDATVDAYYSTRPGLVVELGWNANTYLPEFEGCTHPEHQG